MKLEQNRLQKVNKINLLIVAELLTSRLTNIAAASNKRVNLTSSSRCALDHELSIDWQQVFTQVIKKLVKIVNCSQIEILTTDNDINIYFKNWDKNQDFLTDQNIINSFNFLEITKKGLKIQVRDYSGTPNSLIVGFSFD